MRVAAVRPLRRSARSCLVVLALTTDRFLTVDNIKAILSSASIVGIMALGLTFVTLVGVARLAGDRATAVMGAMVFLAAAPPRPRAGARDLAGRRAPWSPRLQGAIIGAWGANPVILTIGAGFLHQRGRRPRPATA